jgi:L-erythrulose 1-phosphate isomerase
VTDLRHSARGEGGAMFWVGTSWKMNKTREEAIAFAGKLWTAPIIKDPRIQPFIIPAFPYIAEMASLLKSTRVKVGAQNMHWADQGAWTGEVSAPMIKDCGAVLVELGHSERRTFFNETDDTVALKAAAAVKHGLLALVCIGDTKAEYDAGETPKALERQVRAALSKVSGSLQGKLVFAYEPVWSIGEGGVPADPAFANEQHQRIKKLVRTISGEELPILYGGSVNPQNCRNLAAQPAIDGLFIGRSAWDVAGYIKIMEDVADELRNKS